MKIREVTYENCKECGHTLKQLSEEIYACDNCNEEITDKLRMRVFTKDEQEDGREAYDLTFCSWKCCLEKLKKIKRKGVEFIDLPHISVNLGKPIKGQKFTDLIKAMKEFE